MTGPVCAGCGQEFVAGEWVSPVPNSTKALCVICAEAAIEYIQFPGQPAVDVALPDLDEEPAVSL